MDLELDKLHEECGVVAVHGHPEAAKLCYLGLHALQHRGQESAGIAASDGAHVSVFKSMGLVSDIFNETTLRRVPGHAAIGHTRYSTAGDSALLNAQPIMVDCNKGRIAIAHNGNLTNSAVLRQRFESNGSIFQTTSDTEIFLHLIAQSHETTIEEAFADAMRRVEGAYSLVMVTADRLYAARDPHGYRPLAMGRILREGHDAIVFASETCAFDLFGAEYLRDVKPGEMIVVDDKGVHSRFFAPAQSQQQCIFEHVYFSRPDSIVFGRSVQESRETMGRLLAQESAVPADIVVPLPDSGVTAAIGYALESQTPLRFGLVRNHYVGRTFIEPEQKVRDFGVRLKLNPVRQLLEGKRVVLVDDSIVRGTTSKKIVRMVRDAGAEEVHMRISCPPTTSSCYYGVDTPERRQLIAASKSVEEIRQFIGADSLAFLSLDGLRLACGEEPLPETNYCVSCYTGKYCNSYEALQDIRPAEPSPDKK